MWEETPKVVFHWPALEKHWVCKLVTLQWVLLSSSLHVDRSWIFSQSQELLPAMGAECEDLSRRSDPLQARYGVQHLLSYFIHVHMISKILCFLRTGPVMKFIWKFQKSVCFRSSHDHTRRWRESNCCLILILSWLAFPVPKMKDEKPQLLVNPFAFMMKCLLSVFINHINKSAALISLTKKYLCEIQGENTQYIWTSGLLIKVYLLVNICQKKKSVWWYVSKTNC
jgi:hypothetical protein